MVDCIKNLDKCKAECCRWMEFGDFKLDSDQIHYYTTHGCQLAMIRPGFFKIRVPIKCPKLGDDYLCKLHGTDDKPAACQKFDENNLGGAWIPPSCILCKK